MAYSTKVSTWVTCIHSLTNVDIEARAADPAYVSIAMLIEEATAEYTMLVASNCWGPKGKPDPGNAPEALFTKADINTLIQKQISTALHQNSNNKEKAAQTSNENKRRNPTILQKIPMSTSHASQSPLESQTTIYGGS